MRTEAITRVALPYSEPASAREELLRLSPYYVPQSYRGWLLVGLGFVTLILLIVIFLQPVALESKMGALVVSITALLPMWLWISGKAPGLPFFPIIALQYILSYGVPLVSSSATFQQYKTVENMVINYKPSDHFATGVEASLYLIAGTLIWFFRMQQPLRPPRSYRQLHPILADTLFISLLVLALSYQMSIISNSISTDFGLLSLIRAAALGLSGLSTLILFYRAGKREITPAITFVASSLVVSIALVANLTLYLGYGIGILVLAITAFSLGRGRVPLFATALVLILAVILHHGKGEMRYQYWHTAELEDRPVESFYPLQYYSLYEQWFRYGIDDLRYSSKLERENKLADWRLLDRMGVAHMFLLVYSKTNSGLPFLHGETYSKIPLALIPRIFYPGKPQPHEGAFLMNIHFGMLTKERLQSVYIEWGYVAEAYANYGTWGVVFAGIIVGFFASLITRICVFTPVLSFRTMVATLCCLVFLSSSSSTGIFVVTLFQGLVILIMFATFFMQTVPFSPFGNSQGPSE